MRHQHRWRSKTVALSSTRMCYHTEWMMDADRMVRGSSGRNSRKVGMLGRWDFPNSHHPLNFFVFFSSNDELPHDASKDSYACVAYLRKGINKQVYCTLVMANAKVVTRKALRMWRTIIESNSLSLVRLVLRTDSEAVLTWIRSDHGRYRQFVTYRMGEILMNTNAGDWRWIPSK